VKTKILNLAIVLLAICSTQVQAQQSRTRNNNSAPAGLMASLPQSDAVAQVKIKQLLGEALPRILANNPAKLAEINASIESFKTRTGLDPQMFEQVALGVRFIHPAAGVAKAETVALANGAFNPAAMVAAGRVASNGNYREEKYQGKNIHIFKLDENVRLLGVFDFRITELAAAPLDGSVLALGDLTSVKAAIDAGRQRKRAVNADLIALANKDPNALIGFGSTVNAQLVENLDLGNAQIATELSRLRQVYGSVGTSETNLELFVAARAINADAAQSLGLTLEGFKQLGSFFIGRLSGARGVLAKSALANLTIVTQANELQIRTAVAQADVGPLMGK
jgi:hypothetical protein